MSKMVSALPNQSLLDMILTEYGSLEAGMMMAAANNVDISHIPVSGEYKIVPAVAVGVADSNNINYLRSAGITLGTLALMPLGFSVVLKPRLHVVPNAVGDPHTLGFYSYDLKEASGFINANPLVIAYLSDNKVHYQTEERYLAGYADEITLPVLVPPMTAKTLAYKPVWTVGIGYMIVWSDLTDATKTATFKDIEGNEAYCAPLTVLDNSSMGVIEHLMGDIAIELISASTTRVYLRLTRSHPDILLSNFHEHSMEWLAAAATGTPDPADPANPDKTIIALGIGTHTIGMRTRYYYPGGTVEYPSSAFTMVLKVQ
jgi:hypothetical protein